jgi:hypothetical protein
MLQKVAMCQALRLAFSISGLYDRDEINDAPPTTVNLHTGEIVDGAAREVPAESPAGARVVAPERRAPSEAATDAPDPAYGAAVHAFKHNAALAGYETPEAQTAYVREQFPDRRIKSLTAAEWTELAERLRSMYAPDESEVI